MNRSQAVILAHEQLGDEECTEQKEDGYTEVAKKTNVVEPEMPCRIDRQVIHAMHREDAEKREKAQNVQLRPKVAVVV
jgi:hypothetical protein